MEVSNGKNVVKSSPEKREGQDEFSTFIPQGKVSTETKPVDILEEEKTPETKTPVNKEEVKKEEVKQENEDTSDKEAESKEGEDGQSEEEQEESSLTYTIFQKLGVDPFTDKDGNVVNYLNPEGQEDIEHTIIPLIKDLSEHKGVEYFNEILQQLPKSRKFIEYELNGGNIEDLIAPKQRDYSKITLDTASKDKETQWKQIIVDNLVDTGMKATEAEKYANVIISSGDGKAFATESLKEIQTRQTERESRLIAEAKQAREAENQKAQVYWNGIYKTVVEIGKIGNWELPADKAFREDLFNKLLPSIKDENGQLISYVDKYWLELPEEVRLQEKIRLALGRDVSKIIIQQERKKEGDKLQKLLKSTKEIQDKKKQQIQKPESDKVRRVSISEFELLEQNTRKAQAQK